MSRAIALSTLANSASTTNKRGSLAPGSAPEESRQRPDEPFAAGQPGRGARCEAGICFGHERGHLVPGGAFAGFGGLADDHGELVGVMPGGLRLPPRRPGRRSLRRRRAAGPRWRRDRLRCGGRSLRRSGRPVLARRLGREGRASRAGRAVRPRRGGRSSLAVTSASAARAEDSSTIPLPEANAATSDWTARLFTARGSPRDAWIDDRHRVVGEDGVGPAGDLHVMGYVAGALGDIGQSG